LQVNAWGWHQVASGNGRDFTAYYFAWQAGQHGVSPYDLDAKDEIARAMGRADAGHFFWYPVAGLWPFVWSHLLTLPHSAVVWFWVSQLLLAVLLIGLALLYPSRFVVPFVCAVLVFWRPLTRWELYEGQANLLVCGCLVWGLLSLRRGYGLWGGLL